MNSPCNPLMERVRQGLDLELDDIMRLEFPTAAPDDRFYRDWRRNVEAAIWSGELPTRLEDFDGHLPADEWISPRDYLKWRRTQPDCPPRSKIHLWKAVSQKKQPLPKEKAIELLSAPLNMGRDAFIEQGGTKAQYESLALKLEKSGQRTKPQSGPRPKRE